MNIPGLENIETDIDITKYMQNMIIDCATGGTGNDLHYEKIRGYLLSNSVYKELIPNFILVNRTISQFWHFIKNEYGTYAERRNYIWKEFNPLFTFLESKDTFPPEKDINTILKIFDSNNINSAWQKALERKENDPEGAITISRSILESVCKHILDKKGIEYNSANIDLSELYKKTAKELNLAPEQHHEDIFKQILGGCSAIVNGLGNLRNKLGDAHGKSQNVVKPSSRHAELAVNLAGSMSIFLIKTYEKISNEIVKDPSTTPNKA